MRRAFPIPPPVLTGSGSTGSRPIRISGPSTNKGHPEARQDLSGNCTLSAVGLRVEFAARMSRRIRIFQVDAFTTERFTGNPAGVVLDADSLTDGEMLAIARELNNADTAFVLKPDGTDHELRVRFFTPRTEANFVGHATVATHFVLSRDGAHTAGQVGTRAAASEVGHRRHRGARRRRHAPHRGSPAGAATGPAAQRSRTTRGARCARALHRRHRYALPAANRRWCGYAPDDRRAQHRAAQAAQAGFLAPHHAVGAARRGGLLRVHAFTWHGGLPHRVAHVLPRARHPRGSGQRQCPRIAGRVSRRTGTAAAFRPDGAVHRRAGSSRASRRPRRRRTRVHRSQARRRVDRRPGRRDLRNLDDVSSAGRTCRDRRPRPPRAASSQGCRG